MLNSKEPLKLLPPNNKKPPLALVDGITLTVERPLETFNRSDQDRGCFEFFRGKTVHKIFHCLDEVFWNDLLLQLSQTEPTTWHSLLAFASAVESQTVGETDNQLPVVTRQFSLTHYTRAIGLLTTRITHSKPNIEVLLTNCYLFFALEMILGNVESAITQLQGGIQLIRSWRKTSQNQPNIYIDNVFAPMFSTMITCAFLYGRTVPLTTKFPTEPIIPDPDIFESPQTAILSYSQLASDFLQSAREFEIYKFNNELDDYDVYLAQKHKRTISARFGDWAARFKSVIHKCNPSGLSGVKLQDVSVMNAGWKLVTICIAHKFDQEETVYDAHVSIYEEAIEVIRRLCEERYITNTPQRTSLDSPFLMTHFIRTYLVATKCRNPQIRREALLFLKTFPFGGRWNAAFWNARMMATVAERAIEIEEEGLEHLRDETGAIVPSEWARIHEICVLPDLGNDSKRRLVQFRRRIEGNWVLTQEWFVV